MYERNTINFRVWDVLNQRMHYDCSFSVNNNRVLISQRNAEEYLVVPSLATEFLVFDVSRPPFNDHRVRLARVEIVRFVEDTIEVGLAIGCLDHEFLRSFPLQFIEGVKIRWRQGS